MESQALKGVKVASSLRPDSHQQFFDVTLMFGDALVGEASLWKQVLNDYANASGQCINYEKNKVYFFNINKEIKDRVKKIMGCQEVELLDACLGFPLFSKKLKNIYWNQLIERIQNKLVGWKGKLLSLAGKIQLLKASF